MTYENLIETVTSILDDETIYKNGLTLTYELTPKNHKAMNELLFYKSNPITDNPILTDEFEADFDGIVVKFIKKEEE
jgi:hypothetical protein